MITNGTFGDTFGRLGNQLFQVGLLFAIKERHGYDFFLPRGSRAVGLLRPRCSRDRSGV